VARRAGEVVGLGQQPARAGHELLAGGGGQHAPPIALEQAHAQGGLQLGELCAQRRLRDVAALGGTPEAAGVGHGDGVLELAQGERVRVDVQ
jgi:hypothetical protein